MDTNLDEEFLKIKKGFRKIITECNTRNHDARKNIHKIAYYQIKDYIVTLIFQNRIFDFNLEVNKLGASKVEIKLHIKKTFLSNPIEYYQVEKLPTPSEACNLMQDSFFRAISILAINKK